MVSITKKLAEFRPIRNNMDARTLAIQLQELWSQLVRGVSGATVSREFPEVTVYVWNGTEYLKIVDIEHKNGKVYLQTQPSESDKDSR